VKAAKPRGSHLGVYAVLAMQMISNLYYRGDESNHLTKEVIMFIKIKLYNNGQKSDKSVFIKANDISVWSQNGSKDNTTRLELISGSSVTIICDPDKLAGYIHVALNKGDIEVSEEGEVAYLK
jgi:hypothetical protein